MSPAPASIERARAASGFSLVELIVVVAVISILAAVAVPVVDLVQNRARGEATQAGMEALGTALENHFADQLAFPAKLKDLETKGYLAGGFATGYVLKDSWGTNFAYKRKAATATVTSYGPDKTSKAPNLALTVDGTRFLQSRTRDDMQTIHTALRNYESRRTLDSLATLPAEWYDAGAPGASALGLVVQAGYLPNSTRYAKDAWGTKYVYGGSPADFVRSLNIAESGKALAAGAAGSGIGAGLDGGAR